MLRDQVSRRRFIWATSGVVAAAWYAAHRASLHTAWRRARESASSGLTGPFVFFTADQAAEIDAMAAQILPADGAPGAHELGAVYFIDHALGSFAQDHQGAYTAGLAQLSTAVAARFPGTTRLAALESGQQIAVLQSIETTDFFDVVRLHTLMGCFGNPEYGGNRAKAGWRLLGFEDRFLWSAPFGYYDRDAGGLA